MLPSQDKNLFVFVNPADFKFCDHKHCCIMQVRLKLIYKYYQNEIRSNTSVLYGKYFEYVSG